MRCVKDGIWVRKNRVVVKGVDEMLLRLYNPIIWRSFTAANAHVRRNAMLLFATAFPLQDPGQSDKVSSN